MALVSLRFTSFLSLVNSRAAPSKRSSPRGSQSNFRKLLFIVAFRELRRRHATHQTVIAAWTTTAGHKAMPTGCDRMPAAPRMTTAPRLYSTIAVTNPLAAQLCTSYRASQQATPSANSAAPATRPRGMAAPEIGEQQLDDKGGHGDQGEGGEISAPSSSWTTKAGTAIKASPVGASMMAVRVSKGFMAFTVKGRRPFRTACLADNSWD